MSPQNLVSLLLDDLHADLLPKIQKVLAGYGELATEDTEFASASPELVGATATVDGSSAILWDLNHKELARVTVTIRGDRVMLLSKVGTESHTGVFQAQDLTLPDSDLRQDEVLYEFLEDYVLDFL